MYDFAHSIEDAIEHITHSCCTLEFEDHRPFYEWTVNNCDFENHQGKLNLQNCILQILLQEKDI